MDPQVAMDKLGGFDTTDELAAFLLAEQCRGTLGSGRVCPVARYLCRETGMQIMVGQDSWSPDYVHATQDTQVGATVTFLDNPPVVAAFVRRFDARLYPELTTLNVRPVVAA